MKGKKIRTHCEYSLSSQIKISLEAREKNPIGPVPSTSRTQRFRLQHTRLYRFVCDRVTRISSFVLDLVNNRETRSSEPIYRLDLDTENAATATRQFNSPLAKRKRHRSICACIKIGGRSCDNLLARYRSRYPAKNSDLRSDPVIGPK